MAALVGLLIALILLQPAAVTARYELHHACARLKVSFPNLPSTSQVQPPVPSTMAKLTFSYIDLHARGELSRLLFVYGGVAFENNVVSWADLPAFKSKCPLGQVPVLDVDGTIYAQSGAIQRYAAKLSGLYPEDPIEALRADMISETLAEVLNHYIGVRFRVTDPEEQAKQFKHFGDETVPKYFSVLEGMVKGKYFAGDKVSFADVHLFDIVQNSVHASLPDLSLAAYPKLLAIVAAIKENPNIKVTYFDSIGRGEFTRLLLSCGGIEFVDNRISFAEFGALKPTLPFGQVPTIEVDGVTYSQSAGMARYAAKLAGLYPEDPVAALRNDMISESMYDLANIVVDIKYLTKDEAVKAEKTKTFVEESVPKTLRVLESMVQGKFFGGDSIAHADVQLFDVVKNGLAVFPEITFEAFPKLQAVVENVQANANIAAYIAKHQK
ncbi:hypothetical protein PybrP1_002548 [[Pythium] brassicae (nom. inval.)]|nr:hypothetical protein PybrP1_002548 [[Pythium] brassicae (nom. inval.)]